MNIPIVILLIGLLIFGSFFFNRIFTSLHIPSALFFIVVGIILGLFFDQNKYFGDMGGTFSALTLNVIIYMVGRRFTFRNIRTMSTRALPFTLLNVIFTIILVSGTARFAGKMDWVSSLFLGFVLGGTSSVIIVPISQALKLNDKSRKTLVYESLLTDIICLVGGLIFFEYIYHDMTGSTPLSGAVAESVLFGILSGVVAGILWVLVLISMRHVKNTMFASLAFILMLFGASEILGFNGGFAVLTFGIMSGNIDEKPFTRWFPTRMTEKAREYSLNEKNFFDEIILLIQTYFFVYMGMQFEYYYNIAAFLIALVLIVALVFLRWVSVKAFASRGVDYKERLIMSVLNPKGIIPAVMVTFAFEMGLDSGLDIMRYGYAVIIISLIVSSILIAIAKKDPMYFNRMKGRMLSSGKDNNEEVENTTGQD